FVSRKVTHASNASSARWKKNSCGSDVSGRWASCERLSWSFGIATTSAGSSNAWPIAHRFRQDVTLPLNSRSQRDSMIQLTPRALSTPSGAKQQHLLETWAQFEKEGGIGKTDFDP